MTTLYEFSSLYFGIKTLQLKVVNVWYIKLTLMKSQTKPFPLTCTFALLINKVRIPLISVYTKILLQNLVYMPSIWEKYKESRFKAGLLSIHSKAVLRYTEWSYVLIWSHTYSLKYNSIMLLPIAESSDSRRSGNHSRTTWEKERKGQE